MGKKVACGEALIRLPAEYDVDTVFGIPGVHTLDVYRGIANSNLPGAPDPASIEAAAKALCRSERPVMMIASPGAPQSRGPH